VKLSLAMGRALCPHPQWDGVERLWESFYPKVGLAPDYQALLAAFEATMPDFVDLLLGHRPAALRGRALGEVMDTTSRHPARLLEIFDAWRAAPMRVRGTAPGLALAAIGQARAERRLGAEDESRALSELLQYWALRSTLEDAMRASSRPAGVPAPHALEPTISGRRLSWQT